MANMDSFNEQAFEQKLYQLKDTHDSIASLSSWCLFNQEHHSKVVATWLNVLKRVRIEHRVTMFYLANDVIQYSKRKQLPYVDAFAPALQKATTMVRDESIRNKILRLFKIWDDRSIYDESFLVDLSGLLTHGNKTNPRIDIDEYQPTILYSRLKSCTSLEKDTNFKLKVLNDTSMTISDVEGLQTTLKDRKASEDVVTDIDETIKKVKEYISALEAEVKERKGLIDLLDTGEQYYERDYGEAKVVVNAYKCFTNRVKVVKRKLESKMDELEEVYQRQKKEKPPESQEYGVGFPSHSSFMSGENSVSADFEEFTRASSNSLTKCPADSTYDPRSTLQASMALPGVASSDLQSYGIDPKPVPPVERSKWESSYPSLVNEFWQSVLKKDQRLALHKFSHGRLEVKSPTSSPPQPQPEAIEDIPSISFEEIETEMDNSNHPIMSVQPITTQILSPPAGIDPVMLHNWNNERDFESPESPPTFEKIGISKPNDDVDMRIKDIDHRNLISLTDRSPTGWSPLSEYGDEVVEANAEDNNVVSIDMDLSDDEEKKALAKATEQGYKPPQRPYDVNAPGYEIDQKYDAAMPKTDPFFPPPLLLPPPPPPPPAPPIHPSQPPLPPAPPLPPMTAMMKGWPQSGGPDFTTPPSVNYSGLAAPPPPPPLPTTPQKNIYQSQNYESSPSTSPAGSPVVSGNSLSPYSSVHVPPPPPPPPPPLNSLPYRQMGSSNFSQGYRPIYPSEYPQVNLQPSSPANIIDYNHRPRAMATFPMMKNTERWTAPYNAGSSPNRFNNSSLSSSGINQNSRISASKVVSPDNINSFPQSSSYSNQGPINGRDPTHSVPSYSTTNSQMENNRLHSPLMNPNPNCRKYSTGANIRVVNTDHNSYNPRMPHSPSNFNSPLRPNNNHQYPIPQRLPYGNQGDKFAGYQKWS